MLKWNTIVRVMVVLGVFLAIANNSSASSSTLIPNYIDHVTFNVLFTEMTNTVSGTPSNISNFTYNGINVSDNLRGNTTGGSTALDAGHLVNFTLPIYQSINSISILAEGLAGGTDQCALQAFNRTSGVYYQLNRTAAACTADTNLTANITVGFSDLIGGVNGRIFRIVHRTNGTDNQQLRSDFIRIIVNFTAPINTSNISVNASPVVAGTFVSHRVNIQTSREGTLSDYSFEWNATGTNCDEGFRNVTNGSLSGTLQNLAINHTVPSGCSGKTVGYRFWVNNTDNFLNNTAIQTYSVTAPGADTCTYGGSGDWTINLGDSCTLSTTATVYPNTVYLTGTGSFYITTGGALRTKRLYYTPSSFTGTNKFGVLAGGRLIVSP